MALLKKYPSAWLSLFYTYLQNIVDDYNSFANEVNEEITRFENDTNTNYEEFTSSKYCWICWML